VAARTALGPGDTLGAYRLEAPLGEGSAGIVFRARREPDGEVVALKVLRQELAGDLVQRRRFEREATVALELRHRHLVPVLDAGEAGSHLYLASAYVEGRSLAARLATGGPLTLDELLRLVAELASGLDALHRAGLVHRDVKPENVLLDREDRALLTDFGLAKGRAHTVLTRAGQALGTLDYMAPELLRGGEAAPASDIYSLGCVAFECVAGQPPFGGRGLLAIGTAHVAEQPPDPLAGRPELPRELGWALLAALAKDPADRPRTAMMYAHMLRLPARG
jgi:serine/threonine-protein kinase